MKMMTRPASSSSSAGRLRADQKAFDGHAEIAFPTAGRGARRGVDGRAIGQAGSGADQAAGDARGLTTRMIERLANGHENLAPRFRIG